MEERRSPEYTLEIFADRACVKDIVKAILHTIFFHRYFTPLRPSTHDLLEVTLPHVSDDDLETLVEQRANTLVRQFDITPAGSSSQGAQPYAQTQRLEGGRGQVVLQFTEKKRRKGWFGGKAEEEMVWETWILDVTLATPRTETGESCGVSVTLLPSLAQLVEKHGADVKAAEAMKARRAMEMSLQKTAMKIINIVNRDRNHIPPITTNETNPFPYQILVNPKNGWGQRMGIF